MRDNPIFNLRRCCEILEIRPAASLDEAKQAFRDLVNIWHPDKYASNPRLMEKAELKLKEINWAWEQFQAYSREQELVSEEHRQKERDEAKRQRQARDRKMMVLSELRTAELDIRSTVPGDLARAAYQALHGNNRPYDPDPGLTAQKEAFVQPEAESDTKSGEAGDIGHPGIQGATSGYVLLKEAVVDHVQRHPDEHDSLVRTVQDKGIGGQARVQNPHIETATEVTRKMALLSETYLLERREKELQELLERQKLKREMEEIREKSFFEQQQNFRIFTARYLDRYRTWLTAERERFDAAEHARQRRSGIYRILHGMDKQREFLFDTPDIRMIMIPGGAFDMGKDDKGGLFSKITGHSNHHPRHMVTVRDFYLSKHPVTEKQWSQVMGTETPEESLNMPVKLCWDELQRFIGRLNGITGLGFRLPTEAEWEYAARGGGLDEGWPGEGRGSSLFEYASFDRSDVGLKLANGLGLYDMLGNVGEWVGDWYDQKYYASGAELDPTGPEQGDRKVVRGNVFFDPLGKPVICDSFSRSFLSIGKFNRAGFRLAHYLL